ncbi:hypothetical protein WME79_49015 [Sorangium sp. So ce726]|uniref:hypothetical protein n=1 Tax=Sorangium sp. So ce726 TaxID=3133319 RepID=UPI003F64171D
MRRMTLPVVLAAGLALVACGDEGDETAIALDENRQLGELTTEEASQVCDDLKQPMKLAKADQCDLVGLLNSSEVEDCVAIWRQCLLSAGEPLTSTRCFTYDFEGCVVTVAEAKTCLIAMADTLKALSCGSSLDLLQPPAECVGVRAFCPSILENGEGF